MDDFTNRVNRHWDAATPAELGALVLWNLNAIHPFINGNGRTARAACFFVICLKAGGWLPYNPVLPVLIKQNNEEYIAALREADGNGGDTSRLAALLSRLLQQQVTEAAANN
jgi:Fic family protein